MRDRHLLPHAEFGDDPSGYCGFADCNAEEREDPEVLAFPETNWIKPITMEITFKDPDPVALGILTGGVMGTMPEPEFSMNIVRPAYPVRRRAWRVVWEWLTRTPRKYHPASQTYFPRVRLMTEEESDD